MEGMGRVSSLRNHGFLIWCVLAPGIAFAQEAVSPSQPETLQDAGDRARERRAAREAPSTPEKTRLRLFLDDVALSPTLSARLAFSAALDQREREPGEWGGGADGFGKRLAARAGLNAAQASVQHATAALLRVDPRGESRSCHCGHPLRRTTGALARTFVTRDDRGRLVPNVPLVAGAYGGAWIASAWYPPSYRANREGVRVASLTIAAQAGANVFREFAPEMKRMIPGRSPQKERSSAGAQERRQAETTKAQ
jgi:hypothetical protein